MHNFRNMQRGKVMLKLIAVVGQGSLLHWYWQYGGDVHAVFCLMQWYEWCFICGDDGWLWWESRWGVPWSQRVSGKQYYATHSLFYFPTYYQHQSIPNNLWVGNLLIQKKTISSKKNTLFLNELQTYILIRDSLLPRITYRVIADCAQIQSILNGGTDLSNPPRIQHWTL